MILQLVLQFRGESLSKFLELKIPEEDFETISKAPDSFDGIVIQKNGINVFYYTNDPAEVFRSARSLLANAELASGFTAAYRVVASSKFRILWPKDATNFTL